MLEEDCEALLNPIGVLIQLLELAEEVFAVRDPEDLGLLVDARHIRLENDVECGEHLDLIGELLVDL